MAKKNPKLNFPDRKISETFLQFAEPLLNNRGPNVTDAQVSDLLKMVWMAWNAVVYADVAKKDHLLDLLRTSAEANIDLQKLIEWLIDRKRMHFGDDDRVIGEYEVFYEDGECRFRAEARNPLSTQD